MILAQTQTARSTFRLSSVLNLAIAMANTRQQRQHLATLDADALHDLGLTRSEVASEVVKPFWDVPQNWTRC